MFIDCHSDILHSLVNKLNTAEFHNCELKKGKILGSIHSYYDTHTQETTTDDIIKKVNEVKNKINGNNIFGFEGLDFINSEKDFLKLLDHDFKCFSFTWNYKNKLGAGALEDNIFGITPLGFKILNIINKHKLIFDVSHLNENSFYDIMNNIDTYVIASHSNCKSIKDHKRNLDDKQLKLLKSKNGLLCITSIKDFLDSDSIESILKNIDHAISIMGEDNVAIGFDYLHYMNEKKNVEQLKEYKTENLLLELRKRYSTNLVNKITHQNAYNYLKFFWR